MITRSVLLGAAVFSGMCACGPMGCSSSCNACIEGVSATLDLSCGPTNLSEVRLTGVCSSREDASPNHYVTGNDPSHVYVTSSRTGACHVELVFATGFVFATDIQFQASTEFSCSGCPAYPRPSPGTVNVDNPASTCVTVAEAGGDADAATSADVESGSPE